MEAMMNKKKNWSPEEEKDLLDAVRRGEFFDKIAMRHERTPNAIRLRFGMICKKALEKSTLQDLCREYRMEGPQLERCIRDWDTIQNKSSTITTTTMTNSLTDIQFLKEELASLHRKIDKIYKHVRKDPVKK